MCDVQPAAAVAALEKRVTEHTDHNEKDADFIPYIFEASDDITDDETPRPPNERAEATLPAREQRRLRELARFSGSLRHSPQDTKLTRCVAVVRDLLQKGFHPIIWCRYVASAEYVAEGLRRALSHMVQITAITGRQGDEERREIIEAVDADHPRVLVATDCISEGINLQEKFTSVLHYDLPWNPNRLEQREGRVDRYGQTAPQVKAVRFYGRDNPVDGAVIEVLLDKARNIHRTLGTCVPVPQESESVLQAVLNSLFTKRKVPQPQLSLFSSDEQIQAFHERWDPDVERERINRTRFAQRALKPEEVQRELEATDGQWLEFAYEPYGGTADLCAVFYRRAFDLHKPGGRLGMVATNSIGQGDTRESGLAVMVRQGGLITFARRFVTWPGAANVEVNLVSVRKADPAAPAPSPAPLLDGQPVEFISSRLDPEPEAEPRRLRQNENKAFQGDIVRGLGFVLDAEEAERLLARDPRNADCLFPYLNGDDLNRHPEQQPSRWVICFHDWDLEKAEEYPDLIPIVWE